MACFLRAKGSGVCTRRKLSDIHDITDISQNDKSELPLSLYTMSRFTISDIFGQTVVGSFSAWDHIVKGHTEMIDKEEAVKHAIEKLVTVHLGNTASDRLFRGETFTSGFWNGSFAVVVVEYNKQNVGFLRTAYLSGLEPRGTIIWSRS